MQKTFREVCTEVFEICARDTDTHIHTNRQTYTLITILRTIGGSRIFRGGDFGNQSERSERASRGSGLTGE